MSSHLEGSTPRKIIKRTHNRNPTFHSFLIHDVLKHDPVPQDNNSSVIGSNQALINKSKDQIIRNYLAPKAKSVAKIEVDSLKSAQEEFAKSKLRNPVYFRQHLGREASDSLVTPKSRCLSSNSFQLGDTPFNFNYKHQEHIRSKQLHGYDIISNM